VFGSEEDERLFLEVACLCRAVICCRLTPLQKAMIVSCVKIHIDTVTLAIGDGANDISMIKGRYSNSVSASGLILSDSSLMMMMMMIIGVARSCSWEERTEA